MASNRDAKVSKYEQDRISELPDPVLGQILSYLPTKNAVAASILSTRWKNIFPFELPLINIDLDESLLLHPNENEPEFISSTFIDFVDKLLNETLPSVDTFTLKCEKEFDEAKLKSWICAIVRLSVQELQLNCELSTTATLFSSLNGCTTLTRLELNGGEQAGGTIISLFDANYANFSLPTLRSLHLICIMFSYDYYNGNTEVHTLTTLINGCPGLEELYFTGCHLQGISNLHIMSPVLKTLSIHDSFLKSHFTINIPNLELLSLSDNDVDKYWINSFNSLRSFHVDAESWYYHESVRDLVYGCRKARYLYLDLSSIEHLCYANKDLSAFQDLTRLSFASLRSEGWVILAFIMNNAPYLEQITFEGKFEQSDMGFEDFERLVPSPPTCLKLKIKNIEFWHFGDTEDETELLDYFIQNGKVLEKVVVNSFVLPIKR